MEEIDYQPIEYSNVLKVRHFSFAPIIGIGLWKDIYKPPFGGYTWNIILPFIRIQYGNLKVEKN